MTMELRTELEGREREQAELERRRREFASDVRAAAATPGGRRIFRWLLGEGRLFDDDFQPGFLGAYRAGKRSAALRMWRTLEETLPAAAFADIALRHGDEAAAGGIESIVRSTE